MLDGYHMMIPGPITLDQRVLDELALPIISHYGPEWTKYYFETVENLEKAIIQAVRTINRNKRHPLRLQLQTLQTLRQAA